MFLSQWLVGSAGSGREGGEVKLIPTLLLNNCGVLVMGMVFVRLVLAAGNDIG